MEKFSYLMRLMKGDVKFSDNFSEYIYQNQRQYGYSLICVMGQ